MRQLTPDGERLPELVQRRRAFYHGLLVPKVETRKPAERFVQRASV